MLDSGVIRLVISSEFARKQEFELKKIERLIYMRNMDGFFNKERSIKHIMEVNIYYQEYKERMEINVIEGQKWNMILEIPWLAHHNSEIDWRTEKFKMTRYPEECKKQ